MSRLPYRASLLLWAMATLALGAYAGAAHFVALPKATPSTGALAQLRQHLGRPLAVHVLYGRCKCSSAIVEELAKRGPDPRFEEIVLVAGALEGAPRLGERGFAVRSASKRELREVFGVEAAPLLVLLDRAGELRYAGGYRSKEGAPLADAALLSRVASGEMPSGLPLLGCAVSDRLRRLLDPLNLRG